MNRKLKRGEVVALGFVWIFIAFGGWVLYSSTRPLPGDVHAARVEQPQTYTNNDAYWQAQDVLKNYLKAPSTAKFPDTSHATVKPLADSAFQVDSYVDAQNSFGAMLRSTWTVVFQYVGEDKVRTYLVKLDDQILYRNTSK